MWLLFFAFLLQAEKAGVSWTVVSRASELQLLRGLLSAGFVKGSMEELDRFKVVKAFQPHGLGHQVGMDVHDPAVAPGCMLGRGAMLAENSVLTVEPGLYIASNDDEAPEAFRGIGVRIEDDVVVTPDGVENLNAAIPKRPDEIEAWVQAGCD